eukprot:2225205-Alexandrium_andersonii.AAC.1
MPAGLDLAVRLRHRLLHPRRLGAHTGDHRGGVQRGSAQSHDAVYLPRTGDRVGRCEPQDEDLRPGHAVDLLRRARGH